MDVRHIYGRNGSLTVHEIPHGTFIYAFTPLSADDEYPEGWTDMNGYMALAVPRIAALPAGNEWYRDIPMPDLSGTLWIAPGYTMGDDGIIQRPAPTGRLVHLWEVLPCEHGVYGAYCDECGMDIDEASPEEAAIMERYQPSPAPTALAGDARATTR